MSEANDKSKEDALKALHGLGDSDDGEAQGTHEEQEEHETEETAEPEGPSPSASGFVGMLAKEGAGKDLDAGASKAGMAPVEGGGTGGETKAAGPSSPMKATTDQIYMAREIQPVAGATAATQNAGPAPGKGTRRVINKPPGWYHAAVPVMYTLGVVLLLIGFWSIGALIYMAVKTPVDPRPNPMPYTDFSTGYPAIAGRWTDENMETCVYTQASKIMAWLMLSCLPVSIAMGLMAGMMRRQIRAYESRKTAAQ